MKVKEEYCLPIFSILIVLTILLPLSSFQQEWANNDLQFRKVLTINSTEVIGSDKTDFPLLVSITDADLDNFAQSDGDDITFYLPNGTKLSHEIERYDSGSGELIAWVKIPSLESSSDSQIHMYFGNNTITSQQDSENVWDSGYEAVWHLGQNETKESTSNSRTLTDVGTISTSGKIGLARDFERNDNDRMTAGTWSVTGSALTLSAWVQHEDTDFIETNPRVMAKSSGNGEQNVNWGMAVDNGTPDQSRFRVKTGGASGSGTTTLLGGNDLNTTTTYYFTNVYNGTDMNIYVDCNLVATTAKTGSLNTNNREVALGGRVNRNWDGWIDEARVQSIARDGDWICTEYNNQNNPSSFISVSQLQSQTNKVKRIIKIEDTIAGGVQNEDFLLPTAVDNIDKTMIFMSFRHIGDSNQKEVYRSWELINNTAIRFYGSNNTSTNNISLDFVGYIVEYSELSGFFSQNSSFTIGGGLSDQEFTDQFPTAINASTSMYQFMGQTAHMADLSWGQEEFAKMRIINNTTWGYEPFDAPNNGDTIVRYQIIDFNNPNVLVQRGNVTMPEGTDVVTVTPPIAVNASRTMLFVSHNLNNGLDADSDESMFTARIDGSNDIELDRDDSGCGGTGLCEFQVSWETISFLDGSVYVQYLQFDDTIATGSNVQQTGTVDFASTPVNFTNSIAIGTVHTPLGLGQARSASGSAGSFDRHAYTVELIDQDTVEVVTNDGQEEADIWFQVVEFADLTDEEFFSVNLSDVSSAVDVSQIFNVTRVITDTTFTNDTLTLNINATDTLAFDVATAIDQVFLNVTKFLPETVNVNDTVTTMRNINLVITDTAGVTDMVTIFVNGTIPPTPPPTGSGGQPASTPTGIGFQRLIGLGVLSEVQYVQPSTVSADDFLITWFGDEDEVVSIKDVDAGEFNDWIVFTPTPEILDVDTTVDNERAINDPRRIRNDALSVFGLTIPQAVCSDLEPEQRIGVTSCIDPIVYKVPVKFVFNKGGAEFHYDHILIIDATVPEVQCDLVCEIGTWLANNWMFMMAVLAVVIVGKLLAGFARKKKLRVVKRLDKNIRKNLTSRELPKKKFKRTK